MKTVNLSKESPSVNDLLAMAREKSVLLVSDDGTTYLLEEAGSFDREVAVLGSSERFMRFLKKRSKEKSVISQQLADQLTEKMHHTYEGSPSQGTKFSRALKKRTLRKSANKKQRHR